MSITRSERETYEAILGTVDEYRQHSPGLAFLPVFRTWMTDRRPVTVLDAGCCTGKLGAALTVDGCKVTLCDLTRDGLVDAAVRLPFRECSLWRDIKGTVGEFDYVFCCDVLEHIPPEFTMLVVQRLLDAARVGVILSISLVPDQFGVWVGKPLHQTVQPFTWWRDRLREIGRLFEARDLFDTGLYFAGRG